MDLLGPVNEIIEEWHYEESYDLIIAYEAKPDDHVFRREILQLVGLYLLEYWRIRAFFLLFLFAIFLLEEYSCYGNSFYSLGERGKGILRVGCNLTL
jgi:hypothetical protein